MIIVSEPSITQVISTSTETIIISEPLETQVLSSEMQGPPGVPGIIVSDTAPENPSINQLWLDTSLIG